MGSHAFKQLCKNLLKLLPGHRKLSIYLVALHGHFRCHFFCERPLTCLRTFKKKGFCFRSKLVLLQSMALQEVFGQRLIHVLSSKLSVPADCHDPYHFSKALGQRHLQGSASQIKNHNGNIPIPVRTLTGKRCRRGFIHKLLHFQSGQSAGTLYRQPGRILHAGRHADDRLFHRLLQILFCVLLYVP